MNNAELKARIALLRAENEAMAREQEETRQRRVMLNHALHAGHSLRHTPLSSEEKARMDLSIQVLNARADNENMRRCARKGSNGRWV